MGLPLGEPPGPIRSRFPSKGRASGARKNVLLWRVVAAPLPMPPASLVSLRRDSMCSSWAAETRRAGTRGQPAAAGAGKRGGPSSRRSAVPAPWRAVGFPRSERPSARVPRPGRPGPGIFLPRGRGAPSLPLREGLLCLVWRLGEGGARGEGRGCGCPPCAPEPRDLPGLPRPPARSSAARDPGERDVGRAAAPRARRLEVDAPRRRRQVSPSPAHAVDLVEEVLGRDGPCRRSGHLAACPAPKHGVEQSHPVSGARLA